MQFPFPWLYRPPHPESRPRVLLGGCVLPAGQQAAEVSTWLLSRGLYRVRVIALAGIPVSQRRAALRNLVLAWAPFDSTESRVAQRGDVALVFAWDARAVSDALAGADGTAMAQVVPEGLFRPPMVGDGVRLVPCMEGIEAQCWSGSHLRVSRWWPQAPDDADWAEFARTAHGVSHRPDVTPLSWLRQPWIDAQPTAELSGTWSRLEQLVAGVTAVSLVGLTAAQGADAYQVWRQAQVSAAELDRVRILAGPNLAARDRALSTLGDIDNLTRGLLGVKPVVLLRHLANVLPAKGVLLREFDLSGTTLRLGLDLAADVQRSTIVKDLQADGWITDVTELRDGSGRGGLMFEMRLTGLQPLAAAPEASRSASASGPALLPRGTP